MSTRSFIGHNIASGVRGIYCHYDGYPSHTGMVLNEHHNSMHKCEGLVGNGQIRRLDGDGLVDLFHTGDYEEYSSVEEALTQGFDYAYIYNEQFGWQCYTFEGCFNRRKIVSVQIPEQLAVTE